MYKKLPILIMLLLASCGAGQDSATIWSTGKPSLSGPPPTCPGPGEPPKPLPKIRTIEQIAEYANEMDQARQRAEYARTMCARELQHLTNRIHWD